MRRTRPRCCRWAKTGIQRWERAVDVCTDEWLDLTLLYWTEAPGGVDDQFCSHCGHTFGCHLRARGEVLDADGHPVPAEASA